MSTLRFGVFELHLEARELRKEGRLVHLAPQPFTVLATLAGRPGQVVTREELRQALWGDQTFVDFEQGLNSCVKQIRAVLGDDAEAPRFVQTIPRVGYRLLAPVEAGPAEAPRRAALDAPPEPWPVRLGRTVRPLVLLAVGAMLLLLALGPLVQRGSRPAAPGRVTIAVLPFKNLSPDPDQEYFSDGLTEEMIAQIGRGQPAQVAVIARTSAMQYKKPTKGIRQIGAELGADYLLEGSVRPGEDRVRITARLIRADAQSPVWSETYDRPLRDILSVQSEVAGAVAHEIAPQLSPSGGAEPRPEPRPVDPEAYALSLQGRFFWNKRTPDGLDRAVERFRQALARDPRYAPAWAGLADSYSLQTYYSARPAGEVFPQAKKAAERALALDGRLAEAHTSLAYALHRYDWDWPGAERSYRRALELNPSYATARHWYAEYLMVQGRLEEAGDEMRRARQLDPLSLRILLDVGLPHYFAGRFDEAMAQARRVLEMEPGFVPAHVALREACEQKGQYAEAVAELRATARLLGKGEAAVEAVARARAAEGPRGYWRARLAAAGARSPAMSLTPAHAANVHAALGDKDRAIEWLERAYRERDDEIVWIKVEPWYAGLRSDPRFQDLLRRMRLDR